MTQITPADFQRLEAKIDLLLLKESTPLKPEMKAQEFMSYYGMTKEQYRGVLNEYPELRVRRGYINQKKYEQKVMKRI